MNTALTRLFLTKASGALGATGGGALEILPELLGTVHILLLRRWQLASKAAVRQTSNIGFDDFRLFLCYIF